MHDNLPVPDIATLRIAVFAGMAEIAGRRHIELPWDGGTVADARRLVRAAYPALTALLDRSAFAVGSRYVGDDAAIVVGDDVAMIPPVSGG
ncbi:MAG: MoaD/ThiS family protein [Planctomycetia bacterium]|nr:MoaD/ThiS family protein [Planctomycetia bacterium]